MLAASDRVKAEIVPISTACPVSSALAEAVPSSQVLNRIPTPSHLYQVNLIIRFSGCTMSCDMLDERFHVRTNAIDV